MSEEKKLKYEVAIKAEFLTDDLAMVDPVEDLLHSITTQTEAHVEISVRNIEGGVEQLQRLQRKIEKLKTLKELRAERKEADTSEHSLSS